MVGATSTTPEPFPLAGMTRPRLGTAGLHSSLAAFGSLLTVPLSLKDEELEARVLCSILNLTKTDPLVVFAQQLSFVALKPGFVSRHLRPHDPHARPCVLRRKSRSRQARCLALGIQVAPFTSAEHSHQTTEFWEGSKRRSTLDLPR